jgi:hypothetical protein
MLFNSLIAIAAVALATTAQAALVFQKRQSNSNIFGLVIGGARFDPNYLQTFALSYANTSAYLGQIKYQEYSEPLVVSGAGVNNASNGLSFLSIHQAPTGYQEMYIVPHQTQPVGFSVPHGGTPAGVRTTGFGFNNAGILMNNRRNLFFACQNAELAAINSYQIWWFGAGEPDGVSCVGPLGIKKSDACAR